MNGRPRDLREPRTLREILDSYERIILIKALQVSGGCRTRTAASLGISRDGLYHRIRRLKIDLVEVTRAIDEAGMRRR
jgi:DNA-binding NtrC family response regulator